MRQSQPLHTAASHSKGLHGHLNGLVDRSERHDQAGHDDVLHMPVETAIRGLPCVEGEPDISIPQVLGFCKTRREDVRHDGRLDKLKFHDFPRPGLVVALARSIENHRSKSYASIGSTNSFNRTQLVDGCGKFAVNISLANSNSLLTVQTLAADKPDAETPPSVGPNSQAGSPSRGAVAPSSSGIEPGPANQFPQLHGAAQ